MLLSRRVSASVSAISSSRLFARIKSNKAANVWHRAAKAAKPLCQRISRTGERSVVIGITLLRRARTQWRRLQSNTRLVTRYYAVTTYRNAFV